jgi:hypothetical protein
MHESNPAVYRKGPINDATPSRLADSMKLIGDADGRALARTDVDDDDATDADDDLDIVVVADIVR